MMYYQFQNSRSLELFHHTEGVLIVWGFMFQIHSLRDQRIEDQRPKDLRFKNQGVKGFICFEAQGFITQESTKIPFSNKIIQTYK